MDIKRAKQEIEHAVKAYLAVDDTGTPPPDTPPWAMRLVLSPEEFLPDPVPKTPEIDWQENEAEDLPEL